MALTKEQAITLDEFLKKHSSTTDTIVFCSEDESKIQKHIKTAPTLQSKGFVKIYMSPKNELRTRITQ
ncbi:MAG: hypothetical protein PHQ67_08870 [Fermentimonas sp.]|nr:hypothetical protein [Fermentimonas sp.]